MLILKIKFYKFTPSFIQIVKENCQKFLFISRTFETPRDTIAKSDSVYITREIQSQPKKEISS